MQLPVLLDRSRPDSLTNQLIEQLRDAIRRALIVPGAKLPSSRRLAEQLDVSRNTVVRAYEELSIEGQIESRPASGMFVAIRLPESFRAIAVLRHRRGRRRGSPDAVTLARCARAKSRASKPRALVVRFLSGPAECRAVPAQDLAPHSARRPSHGGAVGLSQYSDPAGLIVLRSAIADHLAAARGIIADPAQS